MRNVGSQLFHRSSRLPRVAGRILLAAAVGWTGILGAASAAEVEFRALPPPDTEPGRVQLRLTEASASAASPAPEPTYVELEVPGSVRLDLEPGSIWHVAMTSEDFWAAPEVISVAAETDLVRLVSWPTARLKGRIEVGPGEDLPAEVGLRFESPPDSKDGIARSTQNCPVTAAGRFECAVPATRLDLRLRARSFVSHYFWDVRLAPGSEHDLGAAKLERGASVVGWVELTDPRASFADAEAELSRELSSAVLDANTAGRRDSLALTAPVNERGFFELAGVGEGLYALTVTHPISRPPGLHRSRCCRTPRASCRPSSCSSGSGCG